MFTKDQIKEILNNKNVNKCSHKSITFKNEFKVLAVKQYYEKGYSPKMIFEKAGFNIEILGIERAKDSLLRWRKIYKERGEKGLMNDTRGSSGKRPILNFKNNKEEKEYLKAKIAYLEKENDFLAKLRGIKRR